MASKLIRRLLCTKAKEPGKSAKSEPAKSTTSEPGKSTKSEPEKSTKSEPPKTYETPDKCRTLITDGDKNLPDLVEKLEEVTVNCQKYIVQTGEFSPHQINVSLHGAQTRAGKMVSLLLAHNPLVKKLYLYDKKFNEHLADDLNNIDKSSTIVRAYHGASNFEHAFRAADIAVLIDTDRKHEKLETKFEVSYKQVKQFAENCTIYCPRAILIICVEPLCYMVPLVQNIFDETPWFHPSKLIGNITHIQSTLNTVAANYLNLNPTSVHIPLLGGPSAYSIVPLVSQMTPDPGLNPRDQIRFYELLKTELVKIDKHLLRTPSTLNEGYSIARMVSTVAKGLCGKPNVLTTAFIRTNVAPQVRYLVSTVKLGRNGICNNYGMPKLTSFEVKQLLCAITLLNDREKMLRDFLNRESKKYKQIFNY